MAKSNSANIWFEEQLWKAADKMRNNMDPAEYKHIILWLIFFNIIWASLLLTWFLLFIVLSFLELFIQNLKNN